MKTIIITVLTKVLTYLAEWALGKADKYIQKKKVIAKSKAERIEDNAEAEKLVKDAESEAERIAAARKHLARK